MRKIIIDSETTKNPITFIGKNAGYCYGSDVTDDKKNYKRGIDCLKSLHGRTLEYPTVHLVLDGNSAKVMREWYTHIGGLPSRLQSSTRYISYKNGFKYITPHTIEKIPEAKEIYDNLMKEINSVLYVLETDYSIPREDSSMILPLAMETTVVGKYNLRTLIEMSHQRECTRAFWEYRELFSDLKKELSNYSEEWKFIVDNYFKPKCEFLGYCPEKDSCGRIS